MATVIVHTTTGKTFTGKWEQRATDEADGWDHLMTTTVEGEGFKDVNVAILISSYGPVFIPTANILAVEIRD